MMGDFGCAEVCLRRSHRPIVIAARPSPLARAQAELVAAALRRAHPRVVVRFNWITSEGDRHQAVMTGQPAGGKGQFTGAIEQAVLAGEADLAVHSLKDMAGEDTKGLTLAAIPPRAATRDCLITHTQATSLETLPSGAVVGTSSPRRAAQVRRLRPDVRIRPIRGNVQTRLSKVLEQAGDERYDATLLAIAGLSRCGLADHATRPIAHEAMLPAACQGALGLQCRVEDHITLTRCLPLNDSAGAAAAHAERQVVAALDADCHSPVAVLAEPIDSPPEAKGHEGPWFHLQARVLSPDGAQCASTYQQAPSKQLRYAVSAAIDHLKQQGADQILAAARQNPLPLSEAP
jgi:hydroxymethylbilane synthase